MTALMLIIHIFLGATLAGVFVVVALVAGAASMEAILASAAAGFVLAFPPSYLIAKRLTAKP